MEQGKKKCGTPNDSIKCLHPQQSDPTRWTTWMACFYPSLASAFDQAAVIFGVYNAWLGLPCNFTSFLILL